MYKGKQKKIRKTKKTKQRLSINGYLAQLYMQSEENEKRRENNVLWRESKYYARGSLGASRW